MTDSSDLQRADNSVEQRKFLIKLLRARCLILAGLLMMAWAFFIGGPAYQRARTWPAARGVVVISEIREVFADFYPYILIEYKVNDQVYRTEAETFTSLCLPSKALRFLDYLPSDENRNEKLSHANFKLGDFPKGREVSVFYDPARPSSAFRRQGHSDFFWVTAMVGFGLILFGLIAQESLLRPRFGRFVTQTMIPTYTLFTGCSTFILAFLAVLMVSALGGEGIAGVLSLVVFIAGAVLLGWLTVQGFRKAYDNWDTGGYTQKHN